MFFAMLSQVRLGGMAATRELFPGFKHSVGAWALLVFREEMLKYLELDQEGFEVIRPESSYTVFGDEGSVPFIGYCDPIDLANHLVEDHGFEAMQAFYGAVLGPRVARKHMGWYMDMAGTPAGLRRALLTCTDTTQMPGLIRQALSGNATSVAA